MEYQGKRYSVVQASMATGNGSSTIYPAHEIRHRAEPCAGIKAAERAIDKALMPKKVRLVPPAR